MNPNDWESFFSVDLTGALLMIQKCIPFFQKNGGGSIINISSTYGILSPDQRLYESLTSKNSKNPIEKPIGYSISKSGILNMTRFLATKFAQDKIRVNTLTLGGVYANNPKTFVNSYSKKTPLGRMADKNEYASPMIFLATDASSYMTGANLVIDGGWSVW
jgi:NAD(P)-dependent dehydrogenase (short-subunit alcohol dehydrogenase family)